VQLGDARSGCLSALPGGLSSLPGGFGRLARSPRDPFDADGLHVASISPAGGERIRGLY
jgi:hypothetical protein